MATLARSLTLRSIAIAWAVIATVVLTRFADSVAPPHYLVRPLVVAVVVALVVGVVAQLARTRALVASAALAGLIAAPTLAAPLILIGLAVAGILTILHRRPAGATLSVVRLVTIFGLIGLLRAVTVLDIAPFPEGADTSTGPPVYLVLLDGYPRGDTLASLGIDNSAFDAGLEDRGFDLYPDAMSVHRWTHLTLAAMLAGSPDGVSTEPGDVAAIRANRAQLVAPAGWTVIDPPVGHVVIRGGHHLDPGGITEMEAHLLGQSIVGELAPALGRSVIADGLRRHLEGGLEQLRTTTAPRVFAHLMAPHPPFLYGESGASLPIQACWPKRCRVFDNAIEQVFITLDEWVSGMRSQLVTENRMLLEAVDVIIAEHPDAAIVLFSDHGGRYAYAVPDEWHRSFLAARTPGHPGLFADEPHAHAVLRLIKEAYP